MGKIAHSRAEYEMLDNIKIKVKLQKEQICKGLKWLTSAILGAIVSIIVTLIIAQLNESGVEKEKQKRKAQPAGRKTVYIIKSSLHKKVKDALAAKFIRGTQNSWYDQGSDCNNLEACLETAKSNKANYLVLITCSESIKKQDVLWEGFLELSLLAYDVKTGDIILDLIEDKANNLACNQQDIDWQNAINKIFASNKFDKFFKLQKTVMQ